MTAKPRPGPQPPPTISGRWLLRAIGLTFIAAVFCAYLTLCLLFYQGQWQLVYHPSRSVSTTPASLGLRYDDVRFDTTETGTPQLDAWWIPADNSESSPSASPLESPSKARYAHATILYLHGASGSLSDYAARLNTLHALGANLFAIDYRGFGQSADTHPSEARVYADADSAWRYLTETRHLDPHSIVLYGEGLGATIAAETAKRHPEAVALILDNPAPPALKLIHADDRTGIVPVRLLFRDRFELVAKLSSLGYAPDPPLRRLLEGQRVEDSLIAHQYTPQHTFQNAPHINILSLFSKQDASTDPHYIDALRRFLDDVLPAPQPR
jgi:pimeloyl-ACP methyl ester carboxylesterase